MLRRLRIEFWLSLATFGLERALDVCKMPEDRETVVMIRDTVGTMMVHEQAGTTAKA